MRVVPVTLPFPLAAQDPNRGKGLHASDIYGSFYKQLDPKKYDSDIDPATLDLLYAIGLAWEAYLEKIMLASGELCARPGELESDEGIKFTPDLIVVNGHDRIGEIKATYMSSRDCVPGNAKFDKYLCQLKLYCYWTKIPYGRIYVLYIHGNWKRGTGMKLIDFKVWDIDFTARELKNNYLTMMQHAKDEGLHAKANAGLLRNTTSLPRRTVRVSRST